MKIHTRVANLEFRRRRLASYKRGDDIVIEEEDVGWFIHFEGSHESLFVGLEKPDFEKGDLATITIGKGHT